MGNETHKNKGKNRETSTLGEKKNKNVGEKRQGGEKDGEKKIEKIGRRNCWAVVGTKKNKNKNFSSQNGIVLQMGWASLRAWTISLARVL